MTFLGRARPVAAQPQPVPQRCDSCHTLDGLEPHTVPGFPDGWRCTDPVGCRVRAQQAGMWCTTAVMSA